MAIAAVVGQGGGAVADAISVSRAFGSNVQAGSLIVIAGGQINMGNGEFAAGACTKIAGTAVLGTIQQDVSLAANLAEGLGVPTAIWSAIVLTGGSLTMQVSRANGARTWIKTDEYTGNWDASRLEDTAEASTTANNTSANSGNGDSSGAALFVGATSVLAIGSTTVTVTPDAAFTQVYESEQVGGSFSGIRRIVATGTTDSASWTFNGNDAWSAVLAVYREAEVAPEFKSAWAMGSNILIQ